MVQPTQTKEGQVIGVEDDLQVDLGAPGGQELVVEEFLGDWESELA